MLGVCVGAASLHYLRRRRHSRAFPPDGASAQTPITALAPKPGDILLFHNARGLNRLITGFTGSPFYHVALYAGDGATVEARTCGVVRQGLRGRETDFVVAPAPEGMGRAALKWAETQVGDGYDDLDLAIIILDRLCRFIHFNYTPRDRFTCGEFVACAFEKAGADLFPGREAADIVPGDFARFVPSPERQSAR